MKRLAGRRVRWICGLMAVALALVSFFANSVQTVNDQQKVAKMTEQMKTICVGRFLIDLPAEAQVTLNHGSVGGLDIVSSSQESEEAFAVRLQTFEDELSRTKNEEGQPTLESSKNVLLDSGYGKTFIYDRRRTKVLKDEGFVFNEILALKSMLRLDNVSVTGSTEWVAPRYIDSVASILGRIRPLRRNELPRQEGFCLGHVVVEDPYDHDNVEGVVMFAGIPGHADVNIVFSSMSGTSPEPGLLERNAKAASREPIYMQLAFTTLREHARSINGLSGEELVMRVREANFTTGYSFQWEWQGKPDDVHAPKLKLELESGTNPETGGSPVQSTLSEEAMLALWEQIANSIRIRPATPQAAKHAEPLGAALGTGVLDGSICPQSGWWECSDGRPGVNILGGQRQLLKQGQTMPQALLLPQQTMWQRLRGVQPSYESTDATMWVLVDKRSSARRAPIAGLEQAIAASESVLAPTGAVPTADFELAMGSILTTGAACPSSGWWRCEDSHALDGSRWFAAGSLLPAATFRTQLGRRDGGQAELIHRRSAWRLVRRLDADPVAAQSADDSGSSGNADVPGS